MEWSRIIDILEKEFPDKSLSKELEVRSQFISDLKSGKSKNPGADFVLRLIEKYNINPSWLLTGQGTIFVSSKISIEESLHQSSRIVELQAEVDRLKKENSDMANEVRNIEATCKKLDEENREISKELLDRFRQLVDLQNRQLGIV